MNRLNTSADDDGVALGLQTSIDMDVCMNQEHVAQDQPTNHCTARTLRWKEPNPTRKICAMMPTSTPGRGPPSRSFDGLAANDPLWQNSHKTHPYVFKDI